MNLKNLITPFKELPASLRQARLLLTVVREAKVTATLVAVFGVVVFARREFLSSSSGERLKLINILKTFSPSQWAIIVLSFLVIALAEGILTWYAKEIAPYWGTARSLKADCLTMAGRITQFIHSFAASRGDYPMRAESDWELTREQWAWNADLSIAFEDEIKKDLKELHTRINRRGIQAIDIHNVVTLATVDIEHVQAAYQALVEFSFRYRL